MERRHHAGFARSSQLLPPGIIAPAKGEVLVLLRWTTAPQKTATSASDYQHAIVSWWGQKSPSSTMSLDADTDTGLLYTVTCGPKAFSRYLRDMQSLRITYTVHHDKAITSVEANIDICKLNFTTPVTARTAISAADGRLLGTAAVSISMSYTPLVSSFEMNEHLASVDHSMPLYPSLNRINTPLRQLNLQSNSTVELGLPATTSATSPLYKHRLSPSSNFQAAVKMSADQSGQVPTLPFTQLEQALNSNSNIVDRLFEGHVQEVPKGRLQEAITKLLGSPKDGAAVAVVTAVMTTRCQGSFSKSQLAAAAKDCTRLDEQCCSDPVGTAAPTLKGIAQLMTQQHLEVQKAFAGLDQQRKGYLMPDQLVLLLRHMDANIRAEEVQVFLWRLWCQCEGSETHITMQDIKAVAQWTVQADEFPGKDFAPRQHLKHAQQAQRARTNARSPPQVSRKRKAQQETHPTASTGLHLTAGSGPSCHDTPLQAGQASRHNRLKSLGSRPKQARSAEAAKSMAVDVTAPQHSQQQSCKVLDAQQGVVSLPLPASTLQAQVSGVPHTQLVLNTMQQLSRTLSSEPRASPSTQGLFQPSILAPGTGTAAAAAPPNAESAAVEQSAASAAAAQVSTQFPQPPPRQQHSAQQSLSPVLQPFLVPAADREQTCQSTPLLDADSLQAVQTSANKAPFAHGDHSLVQPNDQQVGVGQAEGQSSEPADGLPQNLKASGFEQKEAGPMTHMQTGSALQQLISRAQKLKQQLDAHAARRHDRSNSASMPSNSAAPPFSFAPSAQPLSALELPPPASRAPQTQPPLGAHLFHPTLMPTSSATPTHPTAPFLSHPLSTLPPAVHSALAPSGTAAAPYAPPHSALTNHPGSLLGQPGAAPGLCDTAPLPLYSAAAYSGVAGSLPYCSSWHQKLTDITWPGLAVTQAALPLPAGVDLQLGLGKASRSGDDDGSSVNSDPAALVEDALLGELFFAQPEACQDDLTYMSEATDQQPDPTAVQTPTSGTATQQAATFLPPTPTSSTAVAAKGSITHASETGQANEPAAHNAATEEADFEESRGVTGGMVVVTLLCLDGQSHNREDRWRILVKPMARGNADTLLLQQCTAEQLAQQLPVSVLVTAPQGLPSAAQLDQQLSAVLEVWHHSSSEGSAGPEKLAGIVRVPLDLLPLTSNCLSEPAVLAKGRFDIWDIFSSRAAGSVELTALYQPSRDEVPVQEVEAEAATMTPTTAAAAATEPQNDREEKELLSKLTELSQQEDTAEMSAAGPETEGLEAPEPFAAMLCVEIIRACGLLAAVNEAAIWLGGGSSLLGRAKQLGPHSFVSLSLFPANDQLELAVPPLQTSFQAQTFCPEFHFRRQLPLQVDARLIRELSTQEMLVEVWHHCPRSQMVATALSQGGTTSQQDLKYRDIFLGSGFAPLHALLIKPQGLSTWVGLKSRRGEPVGAVQIKVSLNRLLGQCQLDHRSMFTAMPELTALLPPEAPPHARPFSLGGLQGQQARATVYIEEILLPQVQDGLHSRPKSAVYHATYRLPGSAVFERSASQIARAAASGPAAGPKVALGHCGIHWVAADESLAHALQVHPLHLTVHKQSSSSTTVHASATAAATAVDAAVPVGSTEVDLSALLVTRATGREEDNRWLSGTYLLVHPAAKHLGNARVRLKVLLELSPQSSGRASSRQWQVPQVAATVIRAAGYSPRRPAEHGPALRPGENNMRSPSRGNGQVDRAHSEGGEGVQPLQPPHGSPARPRQVEGGQPLQPPQGSPAGPRGGRADLPPVCQGADGPVGGTGPHPQAVSSTAQSPASQGSSRTSPNQGQQGTAVRQLGDGADDKSAPAQENDQQLADSQSVVIGNSDTHTSQSIPATLCIERALHLTVPSPAIQTASAAITTAAVSQGTEGQVAVAFECGGVAHTTPAVALSHAGSATWQHDVALHLAEAGVNCGRNRKPALLHLQVLVHGEEGAPHTAGIVVGTAEVELSLLHVMGQVSGWYNILDTRGQTCGQLKVTIRAPGAEEPLTMGRPQPSNATIYLDSCSSAMAPSPSAGRRLRADISSIAAPKHAAHQGGPSLGTAAHPDDPLMGTTPHQDHPLMGSPEDHRARSVGQHRSSAEPEPSRASQQTQVAGKLDNDSKEKSRVDLCSNELGMPAPVDKADADPKLQLKSQMRQLSELSHLMSQRVTLSDCLMPDDGPEAARGRAGAVHGPVAADSGPSSGAAFQDGAMGPSQHVHTAQRTQHDPQEFLGDPTAGGGPLLSAEAPQEAAAAFEPSTGIRGFTVRTVSLTDPVQQQQHRAALAGLHWGALSDDDEDAGAAAMDGYTSSDDSYGGHMEGFAFEGAVSEADPYDLAPVRQENEQLAGTAAEPPCLPSRPAFSSLIDDDWMFGCEKPMTASPAPRTDAEASLQGPDAAPTTSLEPTSAPGEYSNDGQLETVNRQLALVTRQASAHGEPSGTGPGAVSVPALRPSISFANALPPILTELATQQQQQQPPASTADVPIEPHKLAQPQGKATAGAVGDVGFTAEQQVDASVSDWLLQQVDGEKQPSCHGGGDSLVEVATAGAGQREASPRSAAKAMQMPESHPSLSWQQTAVPPPVPDINADWVFGITPNTACVPQLPPAAHSCKQEHPPMRHPPRGSALAAERGQLETGHHSQPDAVTVKSVNGAQAGQQEASLAASSVARSASLAASSVAPSVSLAAYSVAASASLAASSVAASASQAASSLAPSASLAASLVALSSAVQPAGADSARSQEASLAASFVADSISAQPADAVPASVREAVHRFESWTLAQAAVMPLPCLADASATQAEPLLAHSQQTMQQVSHEHVPPAQAQQQPLQQQQQQQRLPRETAFQPEQAVMPRHESAASQSSGSTSAVPASVLFTGAGARPSLQGGAASHLQQEVLPSNLSQGTWRASPFSTGSAPMQAQASCLQPVAVAQQPQSSTLTFIEATLAAINADQPVATQESRGPLPCTGGSIIRLANSPTSSPSQATPCQADRQAGTAASSSVAEPLRCMQRPPLPGKRAGQGFLTRPRFADAFADPSLYQQPWLQGVAPNARAHAVPRSQTDGVSRAQEGGNSSGPPLHGRHTTVEREVARSGRTSCAATTAAAGAAQHPLTRQTGSQRQADSHSTTLSLASRSPTQTLAGDATCPPVLDHGGRTAGRSASRATDATQQSEGENRHDSQGGNDGELGRKGSRWSAVNAYRQAREAAVRAASGSQAEVDLMRPAIGLHHAAIGTFRGRQELLRPAPRESTTGQPQQTTHQAQPCPASACSSDWRSWLLPDASRP